MYTIYVKTKHNGKQTKQVHKYKKNLARTNECITEKNTKPQLNKSKNVLFQNIMHKKCHQ